MNTHDQAIALLETGDPFGVTSDTPGAGSVHRREVSSGYRPCQLSPRPVHRGLGFGPAALGSLQYPGEVDGHESPVPPSGSAHERGCRGDRCSYMSVVC